MDAHYTVRSKYPRLPSDMTAWFWVVKVVDGYDYGVEQFTGSTFIDGSIVEARDKAETRARELNQQQLESQ